MTESDISAAVRERVKLAIALLVTEKSCGDTRNVRERQDSCSVQAPALGAWCNFASAQFSRLTRFYVHTHPRLAATSIHISTLRPPHHTIARSSRFADMARCPGRRASAQPWCDGGLAHTYWWSGGKSREDREEVGVRKPVKSITACGLLTGRTSVSHTLVLRSARCALCRQPCMTVLRTSGSCRIAHKPPVLTQLPLLTRCSSTGPVWRVHSRRSRLSSRSGVRG